MAQKNVTYCGGTKNAAAKMATPQYVTLFYIVALCDHVGWSVTNCGGTKKVTNCGGAKKCDILWWRKKHSKNGYTAICHAFLHCSTLWPCWMKCDKLWWRKKKWQIVVAQNNFSLHLAMSRKKRSKNGTTALPDFMRQWTGVSVFVNMSLLSLLSVLLSLLLFMLSLLTLLSP